MWKKRKNNSGPAAISYSYTWGLDKWAIGDPNDPGPARLALERMCDLGWTLGVAVDTRSRRLVDAATGRPMTGRIRDWGAVASIIAEELDGLPRTRWAPLSKRGPEIRRVVRAALERWLS